MTVLFIPEKGKVGFVNRPNTVDGRLAYIIYYDQKGKLRKEVGFENWRDKNIETVEFNNEPITGFKMLTNIKRNPYHFGEVTEKVRMYDPRGFEFEISMSNFTFLCAHDDLISMEFKKTECVYSWDGNELVLLPVNSVAYEENMKKVKLINNKMKEKDLIPGASYSMKKSDEKLIYIGKYYILNNIYGISHIEDLANIKIDQDRKYTYLDSVISAIKKKRNVFINIYKSEKYNHVNFLVLNDLNNIEELVEENALNNEELKIVTSIDYIRDEPFEFKTVRKDSRVRYFEDENFEYYIKPGGLYHNRGFEANIVDKNKVKILKVKEITKDLEKQISEINNKYRDLETKHLVLGDVLLEILF